MPGSPVVHALALFVFALSVAVLEVQIEGPAGWAAKLPTRRWPSRWFAWLTGGKVLTGYHLALMTTLLVAFHLPYVFGVPWSLAREGALAAVFLVWTVVWDFLWFVVNPAYGVRRFRPGLIAWHRRWWGFIPRDYAIALGSAFGLTLIGWGWFGPAFPMQWVVRVVVGLGLLALVAGGLGGLRLHRIEQ